MNAALSRIHMLRPLWLIGALVAGIVALPAGSAQAATSSASTCVAPLLSQPFLPFGDHNAYELAPGGDFGDGTATGWQLSGGAKLVQTTRAGGAAGYVLDVPSGSKAVSPVMCVTSRYPTARLWVRDVVGSEGVFFYVSYAGTSTWTTPKNTGQVHSQANLWTLSNPVNVQPSNVSGWQQVRFTFIPGGQHSDFEIYDFYVDPRMV